MFTGLVESLGTVRTSVPDRSGGKILTIAIPFANQLTAGESVAINGCCLTAIEFDDATARFQIGHETLLKTTLGQLNEGDRVNLERAMKLGDRVGGHLVTGHIDGVGMISEKKTTGEWQTVEFTAHRDLLRQMVAKGSIAVDGISLTVVDVDERYFSVMLIPHTLEHTTLGIKGVDAAVNLETDLIGKHVTRWLSAYSPR